MEELLRQTLLEPFGPPSEAQIAAQPVETPPRAEPSSEGIQKELPPLAPGWEVPETHPG